MSNKTEETSMPASNEYRTFLEQHINLEFKQAGAPFNEAQREFLRNHWPIFQDLIQEDEEEVDKMIDTMSLEQHCYTGTDDQGQIVVMYSYKVFEKERKMDLGDVVVHPNYRGKGLAVNMTMFVVEQVIETLGIEPDEPLSVVASFETPGGRKLKRILERTLGNRITLEEY